MIPFLSTRQRLVLLISCTLFASSIVKAQKINEAYLVEAKSLKGLFPKDEIAALETSQHYEYFLEGSGKLQVREKNQEQYIALKPNSKLLLRNYSNNQIAIESYSLKTEKGKNQEHDRYCGNSFNDEIFYTDGQICVYRTMLGLVGQVTNYESASLYKDPKYVTQAFFHHDYPSKVRKISFLIPPNVDIELKELNFTNHKIEKKVSTTSKGSLYTYTYQNVEASPKENNQPGYLHFMPHILVLCKSYTTNKGQTVNVLSSTSDLYNWYASLTAQLNTNYETMRPTVQSLLKNLKTDEEKIRAIYYWVQDNIKYIAFEDGIAGFKPEDANDVFYKRYGDCKGMANLTKAMLSTAGYDARLTWIGTNKIPYSYSLPTLAVDNHMICTVMLNGKQIILDATEKQNSMGEHAERIQGKEIMIENGNQFVLSKVPEEAIDLYLEEARWNFTISGKTLKGDGVTRLGGENKKNILCYWQNLKADEQERFMKRYLAGPANPDEFEKIKYSGLKRDSVLNIRATVNLKNQLYQNNQELYVDLDFEDDFGKSQIKKDRKVPFKFSCRTFKKLRSELMIPSGYQLVQLPEPLKIINPYYEFSLSYQQTGNKIIYQKEIKILKNTLPVSEFEKWNTTIQEVNNFYNTQITLKQK